MLLCVARKKGVSQKEQAAIACRITLLYFSHWVPYFCLIQQSKLVYSHCGAWVSCEGNLWITMERDVKVREVPSGCGWLFPLNHNKPESNNGDRVLHVHCAAHFQPEWWIFQRWKEEQVQMFTNDATLNRLCWETQIPDVAHNKAERIHQFSATSDISNRLAHSGRRQASKSNDYMAKITMSLVQLHTISPDCVVQSGGWLCFTLIWGFPGQPEMG